MKRLAKRVGGPAALVVVSALGGGCREEPSPAALASALAHRCPDGADDASPRRLPLAAGWRLHSSDGLPRSGDGAALSTPGLSTTDWVPATVPATVLAALVAAGRLPEPGLGDNFLSIPGAGREPIEGTGYLKALSGDAPFPAGSPFAVPWWYRLEFASPPGCCQGDQRAWLRLDGVNYRAEVWLNGRRLADDRQLVGTFRSFELDVTSALRPGATNALAIRVTPPERPALALSFVDWNPQPPDHSMGLWRGVELWVSGPVHLRCPQISARPELPSMATAGLRAQVEAENASPRRLSATVTLEVDGRRVQAEVELAAGERRVVDFPAGDPGLTLNAPRLWWPAQMAALGAPALYPARISATVNGAATDEVATAFGVRQVSSELIDDRPERALYQVQPHNHPAKARLYSVNGRRILVRGAGYAPDLLLRTDALRLADEVAYVRHLGLNAIRLEGKLGNDLLYRLADHQGVLVLAGWNCCDTWQTTDGWGDEEWAVAVASLGDQMRQLHNHPSLLVWLNGSDFLPEPALEKRYLDGISASGWPAETLGSANSTESQWSGYTGVKMVGPYLYTPPIVWYTDPDWSGAFGFVTETGTGAAIPNVASLRRFLGADHLWPPDGTWWLHAGSGPDTANLGRELDAIARRFGPSADVEDLARKAQLSAYEAVRAMFEAYGRDKYRPATGVIQWMLNNAWPSLIWHLYDHALAPGGGYFGARKALEPLHLQYSYDDGSVVLVNSTYAAASGLQASVTRLDLGLRQTFSATAAAVAIPADASVRLLTVQAPAAGSGVQLLHLALTAADGSEVSDNWYWLPEQPETWVGQDSYTKQITGWADYRALARLAPASVRPSATRALDGADEVVTVTLENPGPSLAFFLRLEATDGAGGDEVLPVRWSDNYLTLAPGQRRTVTARLRAADHRQPLALRLSGVNVKEQRTAIGP